MKVLLVCLFMLLSCACVSGFPMIMSDATVANKTMQESMSCPLNYNFSPESEYCYRFYSFQFSYDAAAQFCKDDGGELAWVPDTALLKWLKRKVILKDARSTPVWYDHFDRADTRCKAILFNTLDRDYSACSNYHPFICRKATEQAKLCKGEFKRSVCFELEKNATTWEEAAELCNNKQGNLAFLKKPCEVAFIREFMKKETITSEMVTWVALTANNTRNIWKWTSGKRLNINGKGYKLANEDQLFRIDDAEPEPKGNSAKCGSLVNRGHSLKANKCDLKFPFICTFTIPDDESVKEVVRKDIEEQEQTINLTTSMSPCGKILTINSNTQIVDDDHMWESDIRLNDAQAEVKRTGGNPLTVRSTSANAESSSNGSSNSQPLSRKRRNANPEENVWPLGVVPYLFDPLFEWRDQVIAAMDELQARTCVKFVPNDGSYVSYVYILSDYNSCYSYVGFQAAGRQEISLGPGCIVPGIIQHELMHALGFWHEHSRVDRDEYIRIQYENIKEGRESNFFKLDTSLAIMDDLPYDYSSILHYPASAFSISGYDTIIPINPTTAQIGNREEITEVDLAEINILYSCNIPIHGGWSEFGPWSACSVTCGGGKRERTRTCTYPPPRNNGNPCEGSAKETETCKPDPCPVTSIYNWGGCWEDSLTGPDLLTSLESESSIYLTGHWTERPEKIQACADEAKSQNLTTFALKYGGKCFGVVDDDDDYAGVGASDTCNIYGTGSTNAIDVYRFGDVVDGMWGVWGPYGKCDSDCNGGNQIRTRTCTNPKPSNGGRECEGNSSESAICNDHPCPIHGGYSDWEPWTECAGSCGSLGIRSRRRKCNNPPPQYGGDACQEHNYETKPCNTEACSTTPQTMTTSTVEPLPFETNVDTVELIGEAVVQLPFETPTNKTPDENNTLAMVPGRQGNGILLDNDGYLKRSTALCIYDPDTCTNGFAVSLWLKQTSKQRNTEVSSRPHTILTFGVEAEEAETPKQGLGLAVYFRRNGMLKVLLRTRTRHYTVDWPPFVFDEEKWHHVIVQWHPHKGLTLYYKGVLVNTDKDGGEHNNPKVIVYDHFMLGRPLQCSDHFFVGYLDEIYMWERELSAAEAYSLFTNVPSRCEDCSQHASCQNGLCTCDSGFNGDGFYCQFKYYLDPADLSGGAPMYFWPMNKFTDMKVIGSGPLFRKDYMTVSLGIKDYAIVFNGRRDMLEAGDFSQNCFHNPDICPEGFTIMFWIKYLGRGGRRNYILSTGAQPDPVPSKATTGLALFADGVVASAYVRTSNKTYNTNFLIPRGTWSNVAFRWRKGTGVGNGLYIFINSKAVGVHTEGYDTPIKQARTSKFTIGEPNNVRVYNGRFFMDNLAMWETPLTEKDVKKLAQYTLPGQTPRSL